MLKHGAVARLLRELYRIVGDDLTADLSDNTLLNQVREPANISADELPEAFACLWHAGCVHRVGDSIRFTPEGILHARQYV